jgi:hypothetical protein
LGFYIAFLVFISTLLNVSEVQFIKREVARGEVTLVLKKVVRVSPLIIEDVGEANML